jgi:FixJ family two-component response regulator
MVSSGWKSLSSRVAVFLSSRRRKMERSREEAPRILAILPLGPSRRLLQSVTDDAGWVLTLSETPPAVGSMRQNNLPPIVIYDRELSPDRWSETVGLLVKSSPRPYVILLSPNADANLWDELQRVGGSDILREPITRDKMAGALKRAWQMWRSQQQVRAPSLTLRDRVTK